MCRSWSTAPFQFPVSPQDQAQRPPPSTSNNMTGDVGNNGSGEPHYVEDDWSQPLRLQGDNEPEDINGSDDSDGETTARGLNVGLLGY